MSKRKYRKQPTHYPLTRAAESHGINKPFHHYTNKELKQWCQQNQLDDTGNKPDLVDRLHGHFDSKKNPENTNEKQIENDDKNNNCPIPIFDSILSLTEFVDSINGDGIIISPKLVDKLVEEDVSVKLLKKWIINQDHKLHKMGVSWGKMDDALERVQGLIKNRCDTNKNDISQSDINKNDISQSDINKNENKKETENKKKESEQKEATYSNIKEYRKVAADTMLMYGLVNKDDFPDDFAASLTAKSPEVRQAISSRTGEWKAIKGKNFDANEMFDMGNKMELFGLIHQTDIPKQKPRTTGKVGKNGKVKQSGGSRYPTKKFKRKSMVQAFKKMNKKKKGVFLKWKKALAISAVNYTKMFGDEEFEEACDLGLCEEMLQQLMNDINEDLV